MKIYLMMMALLPSSMAFADTGSLLQALQKANPKSTPNGFSAPPIHVSGANPSSAADQQVYDLLSATSQTCVDDQARLAPCQLPGFPRVWDKIKSGGNRMTKITVGAEADFNIPGVFEVKSGVEIVPYNYNYSYEVNMFVAGARALVDPNVANYNGPRVSDSQLSDLELQSFTNIKYYKDSWGNSRPLRFYRVIPGQPMVGFCNYTMTLRTEMSWSNLGFAKVNFPGLPMFDGYVQSNLTNTHFDEESIVYESQLFQIDPNVPVDDYMEKKCKKQFMAKAAALVQREFDNVVLVKLGQYQGNVQCFSTTEKTDEGDTDCNPWFYNTQSEMTRNQTVPRCYLDNKGIGKCQLKVKENMSCQMYYDHKTGKFTDKFKLYSEVTAAPLGTTPCDEGLHCELKTNPVMLGGLILWPGSARCVPNQ